MDEQKISVIFRKFPDGDVIAIFPQIPGTMDASTCTSYMHIGQHGSCDPHHIIQTTVLATEEEYKPLYDELVSIAYDLKVCKRYTYAMQQERFAELNFWIREDESMYAEQESNYLHSIGG